MSRFHASIELRSPSSGFLPASLRSTPTTPSPNVDRLQATGSNDLVGELSTRSDKFRTRWAKHDVRYHNTGTERLHHPLVGIFELIYEGMAHLTMFVFTAERGSKSEEALNLLASWSATPDPETAGADHEEQPRHQRGA